MPETTGFDHLYLSVPDLARAEAFYDRAMLGVLGFRKNTFELHGEPHVQRCNHRFDVVISPARSRHQRYRSSLTPGLYAGRLGRAGSTSLPLAGCHSPARTHKGLSFRPWPALRGPRPTLHR